MQILVSCNLWYFVCVYTAFANTAAAVAILVFIAQKGMYIQMLSWSL